MNEEVILLDEEDARFRIIPIDDKSANNVRKRMGRDHGNCKSIEGVFEGGRHCKERNTMSIARCDLEETYRGYWALASEMLSKKFYGRIAKS